MIEQGRKRHPELTFIQGDALNLPFGEAEFDLVTISFGLRNTQNTVNALKEAHRVTKSGGRAVVVEFSHPTNRIFRTIYMNYLMRALPAIAKRTSSNPDAYIYLADSIKAWPDQQGLADLMHEAGWQRISWKNLSLGIVAIHIGHK
jgi:demethylmenaquinone methyltransferase/2-methoxy-6-polyprenyl-1,4-benzoquinol methylase